MNGNNKPKEFRFLPAVFAVENTYQIMIPVRKETLLWVEVDGESYFDHSNGVLRSDTKIHRVSVPADALDRAGEYTVCFRNVIKRLPYYTQTGPIKRYAYKFRPIRSEGEINIYHLADTHGEAVCSAKAGQYFGDDIDLLVLNGDIYDHSGREKNLFITFDLCEKITGGGHPCVFSRGNHDLRGSFAEKLTEYGPNSNGKSYYTFRLGRLWGIVLDCGEDKDDSHREYGNTVACSVFRREETKFLKEVAEKEEYLADGIDYRLVIVHSPFTHTQEPPFDIEDALYREWAHILKTKIKPQLILSGHLHETLISEIGSEFDDKGQPCPVVVGSRSVGNRIKTTDFIGCAVTLNSDEAKVEFTNAECKALESKTLKI